MWVEKVRKNVLTCEILTGLLDADVVLFPKFQNVDLNILCIIKNAVIKVNNFYKVELALKNSKIKWVN